MCGRPLVAEKLQRFYCAGNRSDAAQRNEPANVVFEKSNAIANAAMQQYDLGNSIDKASVELKQLKAQNPKGPCFIATAVLENEQHPALDSLRSFRDVHLLNSSVGRDFVAWCYRNGPMYSDECLLSTHCYSGAVKLLIP